MATHNDIGKKGEDVAVEYLMGKGHNILARNYRHGRAEIDIISQEGETIVFTEVKTRSTIFHGNPEESVTPRKEELLRQAMEDYMEKDQIYSEPRFDIISIVMTASTYDIHHIEDAFFH